jgi:hypothetical protein
MATNKFDFITTTSQNVIDYLLKRGYKLTSEDKSYLRVVINEATSSSWEEGKHSNGCDCGQMSCPICCP